MTIPVTECPRCHSTKFPSSCCNNIEKVEAELATVQAWGEGWVMNFKKAEIDVEELKRQLKKAQEEAEQAQNHLRSYHNQFWSSEKKQSKILVES